MDLKEALLAFPPRSVYRKLLPRLLDRKAKVREVAYRRLEDLDRLAPGEDPMATTWSYSEREALALFSAAVGLPFPPPREVDPIV